MCEPINRYKFQSSTEKPYVESTIRWKRTTEALPGLYPDKRVLFYGPKFGIAHGRYEQGVFYVNGSPMRVPLEFVTWWAYEPAAPREEQIMADKRSNDIMAVNDKIKEMAHKEAFRYYFSNVDDYDWPDDPDAFIEKVVWRSEEDECEVAELSYDDENGKCMDVWAPFGNYTISAIRELMADFEIALINFYKEAKKLDEERLVAATKYDIILCECIGNKGLNKAIVAKMADMLNDDEFYPVEFYADHVETSAIGFISCTTAEKLQFDYDELKAHIGGILDKEHEKVYEIDGVRIFIGDNGEDK